VSDLGIGAVLREAREEQGRTPSDVAAGTSMRVAQVEAIEADRWEQFGGDVYAKGFLRSYATWLGLDPEPLLEKYRRSVQHDAMDPLALTAGPVAGEAPSEVPAWLLRFGTALGVVALAVGLVNLVQDRTPSPADQDQAVAENAPDPVASPTPSSTEVDASPEPSEPSPSPSPTFDGIELTLLFEGSSWVSVTVDGQSRQQNTFTEGEVLDLEADDAVEIRLGNAGGVRALLNGRNIGPFGESGSVVDLRFTPDGFEEV
jgi:cytoskeletal protein RodZ